MVYAGSYGSYLVQVSTTDVKLRVSLFRPITDVGVQITPVHLNTNQTRGLAGYVVVSCIMSRSLDISAYSGSLAILQDFITDLRGTRFFQALAANVEYMGRELVNGTMLSIEIANKYIESAKQLSGIEYVSVSTKKKRTQLSNTNEEFRNTQFALLRHNILTFEELKNSGIYDLSWLFNEDGTEKKDYRIINTMEDLHEVVEKLKRDENWLVSIDTEFTNLNVFWKHPNRSRIIGMSLSWEDDQGIYIPFMSNKFKVLDIHEVMDILHPVLQTKKLVAHNAMAEIKILYCYGYLIDIAYDTMMLEFNLDPTVSRGSKALKSITRRIFGHETLELEDILGGEIHGELLADVEWDVIRVYGCSDTDYCRKVLLHELKQLPERSIAPFSLDNRIIQMLSVAEFYGAKINMGLLKKLSDINEFDLKRVEGLCYQFIYEYGTRYQAIQRLVEREEGITEESISGMMDDPDFKAEMQGLFHPQSSKATAGLRNLKLSSSKDLKIIFFQILGYPVMRETDSGEPSTTDKALEDWISKPPAEPVKFLRGDVVSVGLELSKTHEDLSWISPKDTVLLKKSKFESTAYPFAVLLQTWRSLFKLQTSFFNRLMSEQADGWYYSETKMCSAETARVVNNIQTLKGSLKRLIIPFSDDYYMMVFDYDQIEFRVMIGIANVAWRKFCEALRATGDPAKIAFADKLWKFNFESLVARLDIPDKDYHREGGCLLVHTTPDKMTPAQRKKIKPVHFSVPYGADAYSIAEPQLRTAKSQEQARQILDNTEAMLANWRHAMYPLAEMLSDARSMSLTPVPDAELPEHLKGRKMGRVYNQFGRYRWFNLEYRNPTPKEVAEFCKKTKKDIKSAFAILKDQLVRKIEGGIRRAGGNYPIQSLARDIFFDGMVKLYNRLKLEGLVNSDPDVIKVLMSLFIHDENNIQVHRSVHPFKMYMLIYEECLQEISGHPKYFMGIAVVNNWLDGKEDAYGASIYFVEDAIARYKADPEYYDEEALHITDPCKYVVRQIAEHFCKRVIKYSYKQLVTQFNGRPVDWTMFVNDFKDYYIKQRLAYYAKLLREPTGFEDELGAYIEYCYLRYASDKLLSKIVVVYKDETISLLQMKEVFRDKLRDIVASEDTYVSPQRVQLSTTGDTRTESISGFPTRVKSAETIKGVQDALGHLDQFFIKESELVTEESLDELAGNISHEGSGGVDVESSEMDVSEFLSGLGDRIDQAVDSMMNPDRLDSLLGVTSEEDTLDILGVIAGELLPEVGKTDIEDDDLDLEDYAYNESDDLSDMQGMCNAILQNYIQTLDEDEEEEEVATKPHEYRNRIMIGLNGGIGIDCIGVPQERVLEAIKELKKYTSVYGKNTTVMLGAESMFQLGCKIALEFPKDKINGILNGVA